MRQVLNDSPWSRMERVPAEWREIGDAAGQGKSGMERAPGSLGEAQSEPITGPALPSGSGADGQTMGGGNAGGGMPDYGDESMAGTPEGQTLYIVRWNSSQTVREALVRGAILSGHLKESDAAQYLAQPAKDYQVIVLGPDMSPFGSVSEDQLKAKTYLQAKQSKQKVNASSVLINRTSDGRQVIAVLFSFPKQTANGAPLISARDKGVQFACKLKMLELGVGFDLRKMEGAKGPDL